MPKPTILEAKPISMVELKERLNSIKERDSELNARAARVESYLNLFAKIPTEKAAELKKRIKELEIPRLKEEVIIKLIDILPKDEESVKAVLQGFPTAVSQENIKRIAQLIKETIEAT